MVPSSAYEVLSRTKWKILVLLAFMIAGTHLILSGRASQTKSFLNNHLPWDNTASQAELLVGKPDLGDYVAICMAVKDQAPDLPEFFVHHYYNIGIRHFYIFDDGSQPTLDSYTTDWGIPRSAITFAYPDDKIRELGRRQPEYYAACVKEWGPRHAWLAMLDADEFLEMRNGQTLARFLRQWEEDDTVGAVGVQWLTHTSAGLLTRPASARKAFTTCIADTDSQGGVTDNRHIKSIVKPRFFSWQTGDPYGVHNFITTNGSLTVGEDGDVIEGPWRVPISRRKVALHHYGVKSWEEYEAKMQRGNAMGDPKGREWWDHIEALPSYRCPSMSFVEP